MIDVASAELKTVGGALNFVRGKRHLHSPGFAYPLPRARGVSPQGSSSVCRLPRLQNGGQACAL